MNDAESSAALAYIGVGSNVEPATSILRAMGLLRRRVDVTASSTFYRTRALGRPGQVDFVNGVWRVRTDIAPRRLKCDVLRAVEDRLGRVRTADAYADRTIDLDLLLYGDLVVDEPDLTLPHPDLHRPFVARCLLEIEPNLTVPPNGRRLSWNPRPAEPAGMEAVHVLTGQLRERLRP